MDTESTLVDWLPVIATALALLVALTNAFGPAIAKKMGPQDGIEPSQVARMAETSAKDVATSLRKTQKHLTTSLGTIKTTTAENAVKIDEILARSRKWK